MPPRPPVPPPSTNLLEPRKAQYVGTHQPSDLLPDTLPGAQRSMITTGPLPQSPLPVTGRLGTTLGQYNPVSNVIQTLPTERSSPDTVGHEMGHATWRNDLSAMDKMQWYWLHTKHVIGGQTEVPYFIARYRDDPSHSFAAAYGWYLNSPRDMKVGAPELYNFIRNRIGFEYAGAGPPMPPPTRR